MENDTGRALKWLLYGLLNLILWGGSYLYIFKDLFSDGVSVGGILLSICWGILIIASFDHLITGLKYLLNIDSILPRIVLEPILYCILGFNIVIVVIYFINLYFCK